MLLVDDLAAGGTKNLRHTPRGLVTLLLPVDVILLFVALFFGCGTVYGIYVQEHPPRKHNQLGHYRPASETPSEWRFTTAAGR